MGKFNRIQEETTVEASGKELVEHLGNGVYLGRRDSG